MSDGIRPPSLETEVSASPHMPIGDSSTAQTMTDSSMPSMQEVNDVDVQIPEEANPFEKKKRKKTSSVWNEFTEVTLPNKTNKAECNHCKTKLSIIASGVTSHLSRHLKSCLSRKLAEKKQKTLQLQPVDSQVEAPIFSSGKYDHGKQKEAVAHWILMNEKPFSMVEEEGFNFAFGIHLPMFDRITRHQAKSTCMGVYEIEKAKLKNLLKSVNKVSLTTDLWKSDVQKKSYMCITGHFIDSNWKLQKRILNFVDLPPPHGGIEISDTLFKCMKEWGIENKIFTISVDNASNNDLAIRTLKDTLSKSKRLLLGGGLFHVRCAAHILNLIVHDGLSKIKHIIEDVKESVRFINASESRLKKFADILQLMHIRVRKLIIDCPTRWNSTYEMLVAAMKVKDAFPLFAQREVCYMHCPSLEDWVKVEKVVTILGVFYEATHIISGSEYPTSNKFLAVIWRVKEVLNEGAISEDDFIRDMVQKMKEKFDKYWRECNLLMAIAAMLDPRFKFKLIEFTFPLIYNADEAQVNLGRVKEKLHELYNEYKVMMQPSTTNNVSHSISGQSSIYHGMEGTLNHDSTLSGLSRFNQFIDSVETIQPVKSELDVYLEEGVYRVPEDGASRYDALEWWKVNELKFRVLSRMAGDILAIPITTVASESTFSAGSRILDPYRASLSVETVEALICGGDWVRRIHGVKKRDKMDEAQPVEIELPYSQQTEHTSTTNYLG